MNKKGTLLLADVASILYAVGYVCNKDEKTTDDFNAYKANLDERIQSMFKYTGCTHYLLFGDTSTNFRKKEFKTYKADRVKEYRKFSGDLVHYCEEKYGLIRSNIFESDDMLTFLHGHFKKDGWKVTLGAIDSDMLQVPDANIYNFRKFSFEKTTKESADFALYRNILLAGHNNEISLKGCGPAKAEGYLKQFKNPSQYKYAVLKAYTEGIPKGDGVKSAVQGYGLHKGIKWFADAFRQSYLIREMEEVYALDPDYVIPTPIEIKEESEVSYDSGESLFD